MQGSGGGGQAAAAAAAVAASHRTLVGSRSLIEVEPRVWKVVRVDSQPHGGRKGRLRGGKQEEFRKEQSHIALKLASLCEQDEPG